MKLRSALIAFFAAVVLSTGVAAQEPVETPKPKVISAGVVNGKAQNLVKPQPYPPAAAAVKASGAVNVQVTIDEAGNVISAKAVSGHPLLRQAAEQAALASTFAPTLLSGQPVMVTGVIVYNFVLPGSAAPSMMYTPIAIGVWLGGIREMGFTDSSKEDLLAVSGELPAEYAAEKELIRKLVSAKRADQPKLADQVVASFRGKFDAKGQWMIDFGKHWGITLAQAATIQKNEYRSDRSKFVEGLREMNGMLESAPSELPADVLDRIRGIAAFNEDDDIVPQEVIDDFVGLSMSLIDYLEKLDKDAIK